MNNISSRSQILDLLKVLRENGFVTYAISDGEYVTVGSKLYGETQIKIVPDVEIVEVALSVDDCWLRIIDTNSGSKSSLWLVWGNSPGELVSDWSVPSNNLVAEKLDATIYKYSNSYSLED